MKSDSIGERRRLPFTLIENIVLEDLTLGSVDLLVYLALAKHADSDGVCWPSLPSIAKLARVHRSSVSAALKRLETRGYLTRTARFRPDGGVTSNVYQLMPIEAKKYAPDGQKDTPPSPPERLAPVAQDDANYIHSELDQKTERAAQTQHSGAYPAVSLSVLLERIKQEAEAQGAPPCFIAGGWANGIRGLVTAGVSEQEILTSFTACIVSAPEKVTFFPMDFLKWRKLSREQMMRDQQLRRQKEEREAVEREKEAERERILAEHRDPQVAARIEAVIAQLPWRRVQG